MEKIRELRPRKLNKSDFILMFAIVVLVFFGIIMVFSSSYFYALTNFNDIYMFAKKQFMWAILGFIGMITAMNIDYRIYKKQSFKIYLLSIILLIVVLFIGKTVNGATRWISLGAIRFQPSEIAKIAIILFTPALVIKFKKHINDMGIFLFVLMVGMLPVLLIFKENVSTSVVVLSVFLILLFAAGVKIKNFVVVFLPVMLVVSMVVGLMYGVNPTFRSKLNVRLQRIMAWSNTDDQPGGSVYQTRQSVYAIGSGGIFGAGLGESKQKLGFVPESHTDIIFSIVCEELGLVGGILLILLFMIVIFRGMRIAMYTRNLYGSLVAIGITVLIAIQVIINIAVVTGSIPVTGMPLPFISYGGSSLLIIMYAVGILLNISRQMTFER